MLPVAGRVRHLRVSSSGEAAVASIENLRPDEVLRICDDFEADTGIPLQIQGQMAFGF